MFKRILMWLMSLFPAWSHHTITKERLENWRTFLISLLQELRDELIRINNTDDTSVTTQQKCILNRLYVLCSEWLGHPCDLEEADKWVLKDDETLLARVSDVLSIYDPYERKHSLDAYTLFMQMFRVQSELPKFGWVTPEEVVTMLLARAYRPMDLELSDLERPVYPGGIYGDCSVASSDPSELYRGVTSLYRHGFYLTDQLIPLGYIAHVNSIGCLLTIRYRLSGLFIGDRYSTLNTLLQTVIGHMTKGVPHGYSARKESRQTSTSAAEVFRASLYPEKRGRYAGYASEAAQARFHTAWHHCQ